AGAPSTSSREIASPGSARPPRARRPGAGRRGTRRSRRAARAAGSRSARAAPAAAALAPARHVLRRSAHAESALPLDVLAVRRAAEPSASSELAGALPPLLGLVDLERPAAEFLAVQLLDGGLRFLVAVQIDEGESARAAGLLVGDDLHRADGPVLARDQLLDLRFRRVEGKITYEQASHVLVPFSSASDPIPETGAAHRKRRCGILPSCLRRCACGARPSATAPSPLSITSTSTS